MKLFRWDRACRASMVFAFFLSPAAWYTYKIDSMGEKVAETGQAILTGRDGWVLLLLFLLFSAVLPPFVRLWLTLPCQSEKGGESPFFLPAFLLMALWQVPFLLSLYPAPGMNDTLFMMENPLYGGVQFPWLYSLLYGYGSMAGRYLFGSREPVIFLFSLVQLLLYAWGLTKIVFWVKRRHSRYAAIPLYFYFLLLPIIGNYGMAAVRDGLFSLCLAGFMVLMAEESWGKREYIFLSLPGAYAASKQRRLHCIFPYGSVLFLQEIMEKAGGYFHSLCFRSHPSWAHDSVLSSLGAPFPGKHGHSPAADGEGACYGRREK